MYIQCSPSATKITNLFQIWAHKSLLCPCRSTRSALDDFAEVGHYQYWVPYHNKPLIYPKFRPSKNPFPVLKLINAHHLFKLVIARLMVCRRWHSLRMIWNQSLASTVVKCCCWPVVSMSVCWQADITWPGLSSADPKLSVLCGEFSGTIWNNYSICTLTNPNSCYYPTLLTADDTLFLSITRTIDSHH